MTFGTAVRYDSGFKTMDNLLNALAQGAVYLVLVGLVMAVLLVIWRIVHAG